MSENSSSEYSDYQKGQDDYQEWLWNTLAEMRKSGLYDLATLEELEQRTY